MGQETLEVLAAPRARIRRGEAHDDIDALAPLQQDPGSIAVWITASLTSGVRRTASAIAAWSTPGGASRKTRSDEAYTSS